ncbi:ATP-dependent helicase [Cryptococcus neoformans]|nr:ATP-dependent helicase [Cryptococcus neoformans var. grubii]OXH44070.1 ATP-dependent helicase [Cryptococcus neoformans var. grubii]
MIVNFSLGLSKYHQRLNSFERDKFLWPKYQNLKNFGEKIPMQSLRMRKHSLARRRCNQSCSNMRMRTNIRTFSVLWSKLKLIMTSV